MLLLAGSNYNFTLQNCQNTQLVVFNSHMSNNLTNKNVKVRVKGRVRVRIRKK